MTPKRSNSRELRELAEEVLEAIAEGFDLDERDQSDLVTSLVRQWITYDGKAMLFLGEQQIYFPLGMTALGAFRTKPRIGSRGWINRLRDDWKVSPEQMPDIIAQVNRAQSAEFVNSEGIALRMWVDPKESSQHVEPLVKKPARAPHKLDYRKLATDVLEDQFGLDTDVADEIPELACSVARQWQRYAGHACIFIDRRQLIFRLDEHADGTGRVDLIRHNENLNSALSALRFPSAAFPEIIARINLGQDVEFRDNQGVRCALSYNPQARQAVVRVLDPVPPAQCAAPPICCPACNAVLLPWPDGARQQSCARCGRAITLP